MLIHCVAATPTLVLAAYQKALAHPDKWTDAMGRPRDIRFLKGRFLRDCLPVRQYPPTPWRRRNRRNREIRNDSHRTSPAALGLGGTGRREHDVDHHCLPERRHL